MYLLQDSGRSGRCRGSPGPVGPAELRGQRDRQVDLPGEPGRPGAGPAGTRRAGPGPRPRPAAAVRPAAAAVLAAAGVLAAGGVLAGAGVLAQQQIQVGACPQHVQVAVQPGCPELPRPRGDPLSGPRRAPRPAAARGPSARRSRSPPRRAFGRAPRPGTAPDQLRRRGQLPRGHVGLHPVPRAQHPDQLIIGGALVGIVVPGRRIRQQRQARAAGITSSTSPLPNDAARLEDSPGTTRADPGCPGPRRPASAPAVPDRAPFAAPRAMRSRLSCGSGSSGLGRREPRRTASCRAA